MSQNRVYKFRPAHAVLTGLTLTGLTLCLLSSGLALAVADRTPVTASTATGKSVAITSAPHRQVTSAKFPMLSSVKTLEVNIFVEPVQQEGWSDPELTRLVQKSLEANSPFIMTSPAEAKLSLRCEGYNCWNVRAKVISPDFKAPVWNRHFSTFVAGVPYFKRTEKDLAKTIVNALISDYQQSQQAAASRIEP